MIKVVCSHSIQYKKKFALNMEDGFSSDLNVGPSAEVTSATIDQARFANFITIPIQFIGTICNIIVLWVWSAESFYVPSTYLFKALAVSDILYLQFSFVQCVYWYPGYTHDKVLFGGVFLAIMVFGNLRNGLLISLVLATIRVIKHFFPLHARRLLAKSRMRIVVICCLIYCIGLQTFSNTQLIYLPVDRPNPTTMIWKLYIRATWGYLLPASLQIGLMLAVVCKVLRQRVNTAPLDVNLSPRQTSEENSRTKVDRNPRFPTESRQFVYVAFAICSMSFVAFVLPATTFIMFGKDDQARKKTRAMTIALFSFNSSVNIIFYMFIPRFRYLFADNMGRLLQTVGVSTTTITSSELVRTPASRRNTGDERWRGGWRENGDQEEGMDKKGDSTCTT